MKAFLLNVRAVSWALLDGLALLARTCQPHEKIVLIVRLDAIGDFVLWLDAARELISRYQAQGYSVVLLGNKAWANWARGMGIADEVWELDVGRFGRQLTYRWRWLIRIRRAGFKIAIQPTFSRVFLEGDSLIRASGARDRIGSVGDESNITPWYRSWSNRWYTRLIPAVPEQMMELRRNAEFMRGLGFADYRARIPSIPEAVGERARLLPPQPYAVLVPAANWEGKQWPIEKFIEIGRRIVTRGLPIVVVGGPADREHIGGLMEALSGEAIDLVGKTSLAELAVVLRGATVVVTNDTSSVHIGAAVDVPVVCILGGGHFGRFAPYETEVMDGDRKYPIVVTAPTACFGCNWRCQYPRQKSEAVKCVQDISVEKVWQAVETALTTRGDIPARRRDA